MIDIIHRIGIKSPITQVYKALTSIEGLSHWWTEEVKGDEQSEEKIEFRFRSVKGELKGSMLMEVLELNIPTNVRWRCIEGPDEWVGTDITFQLSQQDNQTIVLFGHRNWKRKTLSKRSEN